MESINNINNAIHERTRPGDGVYIVERGAILRVDDPNDFLVTIDRARFERLRMLASWAAVITPVSDDGEGYCPEEVRFFAAARVAMKPGDLDPLP